MPSNLLCLDGDQNASASEDESHSCEGSMFLSYNYDSIAYSNVYIAIWILYFSCTWWWYRVADSRKKSCLRVANYDVKSTIGMV